MSQSVSTTVSPRPIGAAEAPDVFFVLRRYIWLVLIGTILATLIAGGLCYYLYKTSPSYTAKVTFQVLAPPVPPGAPQSTAANAPQMEDEIARFIHRQMYWIKSDNVLQHALESDAFQHDPSNPAKRSRWLADNIAAPKRYLKKDLEVNPDPSSDLFEIRMTAKDAVESANLVNAVARVYVDSLRQDNSLHNSERLEQLGKLLTEQDAEVRRREADLAEYRGAHKIESITPRYTVELGVLGELDREAIKAQSEARAAAVQLESIKQQVAANNLQLSAEQQMYVENDPGLRYLAQTKLQLQQQRVIASRDSGPNSPAVRQVDAQLVEVDRQLQELRNKSEATARLRMQSMAESNAQGLQAQVEYLNKLREEKNNEVRDLDAMLVSAQQMADSLKAQQKVLDQLREQYTLEKLKSNTDDSRVRQLGGDAVQPDEVSWPIWYKFVPAGFLLGSFLSFAMAYVFELTNTRVRTPRDITRTLQLPLLGFIPDEEDDAAITGELSTSIRTSPTSMIAESFRQIRGRLIAQVDGNPIKTLLVASIAPGGGATTVASNIATGMALNAMRVLLVDANFYRPGLGNCYKNLPEIGLADVIVALQSLDAAIVPSADMPQLHVMGTGHVGTTNPAEMFECRAFRELLDLLKARFDMIVFDGAPLSLVSDSVALGARVDGVITVVRAGEVSRGAVARVREQLRHVKANFMGVVLNAAQTHGAGYFKENYRSFYEYAGQGARANGASAH